MADSPAGKEADGDRSITALLIENSDSDARQIRDALADIKHAPVILEWTSELTEGIERLSRGGIDVLLLDHSLAETDLLDTIIRTQRRPPSIPIVILGGQNDRDQALAALRKGAQEYVCKGGVDGEVLLRSIRYAIERRRAEEEAAVHLRLENCVSQQIVQQVPVGIVRLRSDLTVIETNRTFLSFLGLTNEQSLIDRSITNTLPGLSHQSLVDMMSGSSPLRIREYCLTRGAPPLSQTIYLDISAWSTRTSGNDLSGAVLVVEDVTERLERNKQRDQFIATLAHDMKVPLIGTDRVLEMIAEGATGSLDSRLQNIIQMLRRSNQHLLWMVHNLLYVYNEQEGKELLNLALLSPKHVISECIDELTPFIGDRSLKVELRMDEEMPAVHLDWVGMRRILMNLLHNATKHTPAGGQILVEANADANLLTIRVKDSGAGIPPEYLPTLFQPFWTPPKTRQSCSAGLGLYVSRRIVEAHGGTISCDSECGQGTTFTITLPIRTSSNN